MPDTETVRERLGAICGATVDPTLDATDLDAALAAAAVVDVDGRLPSDDNWAGAWDLHVAAATAWRQKAAAASARYAVSTDGQSLSRQQVFEHCMRMADWYGARSGLVVGPDGEPVASDAAGYTVRAATIYTDPADVAWVLRAGDLFP